MPTRPAVPRRRAKFLLTALFGVLIVVLGACSSPDTLEEDRAASGVAGVRVVSVDQAVALLEADPAATVVDVRTPAEFAEGHLAGAVLVDYSAPDFRDQVARLPRDGHYVIYCRSGNRSAGARQVMADLGFTDVADIDGGVVAWTAQGQPVTG